MTTKEEILSYLEVIPREGMKGLVSYLEGSTFFTDPASTSDYDSFEGGLAEHSLKVYKNLIKFRAIYPELEKIEESLKIVGLLHDLSLVGTFQRSVKNVPLKGTDGKNKKDENGRFIWIEKESYDYYPETNLPYPPGQLSAILIKKHIKLTKLEDLAIQWHRGSYDLPLSGNILRGIYEIPTNPLLKRAQKIHKLIPLTQFADLEAILY